MLHGRSVVSMADDIEPELRDRIASYLSDDVDRGNDEARELLVDVADALDLKFRTRGKYACGKSFHGVARAHTIANDANGAPSDLSRTGRIACPHAQ